MLITQELGNNSNYVGLKQLFFFFLLLSLCWTDRAWANETSQSDLFTAPKLIALDDGTPLRITSGHFYVPENWSQPDSPKISLPFYQVKAQNSSVHTPVIFLLAGGPGSSWIDYFDTEAGREQVLFYRQFADVVLLDQRGAIHSEPYLNCPSEVTIEPKDALTKSLYVNALRQVAQACVTAWKNAGVDTRAYDTLQNAADIDALRHALGYDTINIIAGSYGSHLTIALMRTYPETIERVVMWGLEGPDDTYDQPDGILESLESLAADAENYAPLKPYIPVGGLLEAVTIILQRLEQKPVHVELEYNGEITTVQLSKLDFQRALRYYANRSGKWPAFIINLWHENYEELARITLQKRRIHFQKGVLYLMDCASGVSDKSIQGIGVSVATQVLGDINLPYSGTCDIWDSQDLGSEFRSNLETDIPVLLFHGTWDMSTPLANSKNAISSMKNGQLVVVQQATHDIFEELYAGWPAMRKTIQSYIISGTTTDVPAMVALPEVAFTLPEHSLLSQTQD